MDLCGFSAIRNLDLNKWGVFLFKFRGCGLDIEQGGFLNIRFIVVKLEETGTPHDGVDDVTVRACRQGRASLAAAYLAVFFGKGPCNVRGAMNDDTPRLCLIVKDSIQAV